MKKVMRLRKLFVTLTMILTLTMGMASVGVFATDTTTTTTSSAGGTVSNDQINEMFNAPSEGDDMLKDVTTLAKNGGKSVVNLVRFIAIAIFIVYIIIVAVKFATGDPSQRAKNRENLGYLFAGIIIFAMAAALFVFANKIAGAIAGSLI